MTTRLLNPPLEASVCRKLIGIAETKLEKFEKRLSHTVLDRENYLMAISAATELRELIEKLNQEYDRAFNI